MGLAVKQFRILLWKNWILKKRSWRGTLFEILLPIFLMDLLIVFRRDVPRVYHLNSDHSAWNQEMNVVLEMEELAVVLLGPYAKHYGILTNITKNIDFRQWLAVGNAPKEFNYFINSRIFKKAYDAHIHVTDLIFDDTYQTVDDLFEYTRSEDYGSGIAFLGGIFFNSHEPDWDITYVANVSNPGPSINMVTGPSIINTKNPPMLNNETYGFFQEDYGTWLSMVGDYQKGEYIPWGSWIAIQTAVDMFILDQADMDVASPKFEHGITIAPFPTNSYLEDIFAQAMAGTLGLFLALVYVWPISSMIKGVVQEKEERIKEGMKIMGLQEFPILLSYIVLYSIIASVTSFLIVLTTGSTVFQYSDKSCIFIAYWLFAIDVFALGYFISVFFSRAKLGAMIGMMILLVMAFSEAAITADKGYGFRLLLSLMPPVAFSLTMNVALTRESIQQGVHWGSIGQVDSQVSWDFLSGLGMMAFVAVLLVFLASYLNEILPKSYGVRRKPWFLCQRAFWCENKKRIEDREEADMGTFLLQEDWITGDPTRERAPAGVDVGVKVKKLKKEFPTDPPTLAVAGISLQMYKGQIFALLGHNGAGKTTLIRMLTGMIEPSSGDAEIYGNSILDNFDYIRRDIGFCPQHDILYSKLTVREHLKLFACIKGVPNTEIDLCVEKSVHEVQLDDKIDTQARALSGGMKRKLSAAIALIGESRIVFLDEPTSGMDVAARRQLQELLQSKKQGRCMILTTHYLDEADFLGDRIAIMAKGKVVCSGSSLFLKQNYGVGYQLTITKDNTTKSHEIIQLVKTYVPNCEVITKAGNEVSLRLPFEASSHFPDLFDNLDIWNSRTTIGKLTYGIAVTTLEEVFLKVGAGEHDTGKSGMSGISMPSKTLTDTLSSGKSKPWVPGSSESQQALHLTYDDSLLATSRTDVWSEPASSKHMLDYQNASMSEMSTRMEDARRTQVVPSWGCASLASRISGVSVHSGAIKYDLSELKCIKKTPTKLGHMKALFFKRFNNQRRDLKACLCIVLIPALVLIAGIGLQTMAISRSMPELAINTDYGNSPNRVTMSKDFSVDDYRRPGDTFELVTVTNTTGKTALSRMTKYLLKTNEKGRWLYEQSRYGAIAIEDWQKVNVTILANTTDRHSVPVYVNLLSNLYLRNQSTTKNQTISVSYEPFPLTKTQKTFIATIASIMINIAISFVPANYAAMAVQDRSTQSKHLQVVSGVSLWSYWIMNWIFDFMTYLVPLCICLIVVNIYSVVMLTGEYTLPFFTLLFFHGIAVIPYVYVLSFFFDHPSTAQNFILMWLLITGPILGIVVAILSLTLDAYDQNLEYLWMIFPNYALNHGTGWLMVCTVPFLSSGGKWGLKVTGYPLIYMAVEAVVYFATLMMIEKVLRTPWLKAWCHKDPTVDEEPQILDQDVSKEMRRVLSGNSEKEGDIVQLKKLLKVYTPKDNSFFSSIIPCWKKSKSIKPPMVAVNNLTYAVKKGECFGFLGVNGAGKTSTLKILTGDILPTQGGATLNGHDLLTEMNEVRKYIGYCPQFDALIPNLTACEHLYFYARIKGLPEEAISSYVSHLVSKIGLKDFADLPCRGYSGGNKRKLSVGIALIGDPPVVFLDEPSSGMDPESRRFMWNLIADSMSGRSLILTTHSMAEAEALCNRIGIMVNGQLRCLGTAQHLRSRFGQGYQIDLHVARDAHRNIPAVRGWILESFENALILDEIAGNFIIRIAKDERPLGAVFRLIEENRAALRISEYSVAETSLEQIFIGFAKSQRKNDD